MKKIINSIIKHVCIWGKPFIRKYLKNDLSELLKGKVKISNPVISESLGKIIDEGINEFIKKVL